MKGSYEEIQRVVAEIDAALPKLRWKREPMPTDAPPGTRGLYVGEGEGWRVTIIEFVAKGAMRYDGGAMHMTRTLIVHLTPELATKAGALAKKGVTLQ